MRKIIFIGRSESGKTTLTQAMKGKKIVYHKTQYINHYDVIIDTPGEYAETKELGGALAVYSAEADVVGLLMSATPLPFSKSPTFAHLLGCKLALFFTYFYLLRLTFTEI